MNRNILVPLDGSPAAEAVLSDVKRISILTDKVDLLHVLPDVSLPVGQEPTCVLGMQEQANTYLDGVRERWIPGQAGHDVVSTGDPAECIFLHALENNIHLIAMTTAGRTGLGRMLLGSVAGAVVRKAQLPVLLVRPDMPRTSRPLKRILIAIEGAEGSRDLLETMKAISADTQAELVLFHVRPHVSDPSPLWALDVPLSLRNQPEHYLQELADALQEQGYPAWPAVSTGDPVEEILRKCRALDADLIALSTHGRSGLERLLTGSVAEEVLRKASIPVLLQKPIVAWKHALLGEAHE